MDRIRLPLFILMLLSLMLIMPISANAAVPKPATCLTGQSAPYQPYIYKDDIWNKSSAYRFPFLGWSPLHAKKIKKTKKKPAYTKYIRSTVLWKKIKKSDRAELYPAPNLPSCRIGKLGTEDRSSYKALKFTSKVYTLDGITRSWQLKDTFDRNIATLTYELKSLNKKLPNRYGWHINGKWAGHDASRMFEVQGQACKLTPVLKVIDNVQQYVFVNDPNYVMIAINPAAGSPNGNSRPYNLSALKFRSFININALPGSLQIIARRYQFGCGSSPLPSFYGPGTLTNLNLKMETLPDKLVNQYFGESSIQNELLPGEIPDNNDYPYSTYNAKPQLNNLTYLMNNTTGVASGGMVRAVVRANADSISLMDQMKYCDPNYTLTKMKIRVNGKQLSKFQFFKPNQWSSKNKAAVRWVFGKITPDASSLSPETQAAAVNPDSVLPYGWYPVQCGK